MLRLSKSYVVFYTSCLVSVLNAQTDKPVAHHMNRNGFAVNLNYIYNHCSYTKEVSNWYVVQSNYSGPDPAYFEMHKNSSARTFGLNTTYNKPIAKRVSISMGIGLNQKKQVTKFTFYEDRNPDKPDLTNVIYEEFAMIVPVNMNFYYRRFILSAGHNFYYKVSQKNTYNYQDNSQKRIDYNRHPFDVFFQESVSFQLIQNKNLYLKISAEQTDQFYYPQGYNNWFMLGGTYYF